MGAKSNILDDPQMKEFYDFLIENYSSNKSTVMTIVYAMHKLLMTGKDPDDLPISTRSKSVYRKAKRLWDDFQAYKRVNPAPLVSKVRHSGAVKESRLKSSLRNVFKNEREYRMAVLKAINQGRVFVNFAEDDPRLIYVD